MNCKYGYIYVGNYINQKKDGIIKIGITQCAPSARQHNIEYSTKQKFRINKYLRIADISKEDLLFVESWVRRSMQSIDGLSYNLKSNDHFNFQIQPNQKHNQINYFANSVIQFGVDALAFLGYNSTRYKICEHK